MKYIMQKIIYQKNYFLLFAFLLLSDYHSTFYYHYFKAKKPRGLPGIEPGTASTLKKNHTTRPKPQLAFLIKY